MDWQPIETAPKDGTLFDVWAIEHGGRVVDAFHLYGKIVHFVDYPAEDWMEVCNPTHWMPLPKPPKE